MPDPPSSSEQKPSPDVLPFSEKEPSRRVQDSMLLVASGIGLLGLLTYSWMMLDRAFPSDTLVLLGKSHPLFLMATPSSATMSIIVVSLFRATSGPLEFEGFGFKFRGASGPLVLWIFTFLACVGAMRLLWVAQ